jgi:Family of unknown function (DUF6365)
MASQALRALFLARTTTAFGETTTAMALAESVVADGGEVWFLASPQAAQLMQARFPDRVHKMTPDIEVNRRMWRRMVRNLRPDVIVFSDIHELIFHSWNHSSPLIDLRWLRELEALDVPLVWIDLMGFAPWAQEVTARLSYFRFGPLVLDTIRSFLERLWVILPCPLHEPGPVQGRRGIPYRNFSLPLQLAPEERTLVRSRFLEEGQQEDILILRVVSSWQTMSAEERGLPLYDYLSELLAVYLSDLPKPVKLISVSDQCQLRPSTSPNLRVVNLRSMPPDDFERLLLSSDLLLTENEGGYTLGKALGSVTAVALVNSYTLEELLKREEYGSPIRRLVLKMERRHPGSIYPHLVYPRRARPSQIVDNPRERRKQRNPSALLQDTLRRGRFLSSPFVRGELYGGAETRELFHRLLCDPSSRDRLKEQEMAYIQRQNKLEDGPTVLKHLLTGRPAGYTVLDGE